jgi:hypothetical protein
MGSSLESHLLEDFFVQNSKLGLEQRFYQKFKNPGMGTSGSFKILELGLEVLLKI